MTLSLIVLNRGKYQGKVIPLCVTPFLIGRDPACQLRPISATVSNRHCLLGAHDNRLYVRDLDSSNGTRVNDELVVGQVELKHHDRLQIGPLTFEVRVDTRVPVDRPTPLPPSRPQSGEDRAGAMLLSGADSATLPGPTVAADEVPSDDTKEEPALPPDIDMSRSAPPPPAGASALANEILKNYRRRPRA